MSSDARQLAAGGDGRVAAPAGAPAIPFPGLEPFGEALAPYFYGRTRDARVIAANLQSSRLTILYGPSAAGKTSVLLAGVVPSLRAAAQPVDVEPLDEPEPAPYAVALVRNWVAPPLPRLMQEIRGRVMEALGGEEVCDWQPGHSPVDALRAWTERVTYLYVILDQFEEYFLYHPPGDEHGFDADLVQLCGAPNLRVHVLLSLREDCLSLLDRFKGKIPGLWDNSLRIGHLDLASARDAMHKPMQAYRRLDGAATGPAGIEDELVERLLEAPELRAHRELATDGGSAAVLPDAAPLIETSYLQLVLRRLWQDAVEHDQPVLRSARLDALGGPQAIVRQHLDDAMAQLSADELDVAIDALRFLVTPSKTKIAYTAEDLASLAPQTAGEIVAVLEKLTTGENRILRRVLPPSDPGHRGSAGSAPRYEIFHDILAEPILTWRAERAAERDLRAERRQSAERLRAANEDASRARRRSLISLAIAGSAVLLLLAALAGWLSAKHARDVGRSRQLAAAALASLPVDPDQSVRLALDGLRHHETVEADQALRTALPASRLRGTLPVHSFGLTAGFGAGGRLATGDSRGFVRVWDWRARRELLQLHEPNWVSRVSLADRGDLLLDVACCVPSRVSLWSVRDCLRQRACAPLWKRDDDNLSDAVLSRDGTTVALATGDAIRILDARACASGRRCRPASGPVIRVRGVYGFYGVAFGKTPDTLAAIGYDGYVSVWRRRGGRYRLQHRIRGPWSQPKAVAISARSGLLAAAGDMRARVWDLRHCRRTCRVLGTADLPDWVNDVEFSRQGTRVVVADEDGNVRVWDRAITEPIAVLRGHDSTVFAATFAADGTTVASTGADGTVRLWDASTGQIVADGPSWINSAVFTRDGSRIVVGSADGTVRVFDRSGGRAVATLLVTDGAAPTRDERRRAKAAGTALYDGSAGTRPAMVNVAVPSPDGRWIFTGDGDGYVMRWDFANCRKMVVCDTYTGVPIGRGQLDTPATDLSVSPDSRLVAAAYAVGGGVQLFDSSGKLLATLSRAAIHGEAEAVRFIARRRLITASANGYAIVWDASGCRLRPCRPRAVRTLTQSEPIYTLAASPDGRRVVTGASDRVARVWNLANPKVKPLELRGHTGNVRAVAFDRSGTRVVTAGDDKSTRVWAVKTDSAQLLAVMEMHTNTVTGVSFDPRDPSRILSSSLDGSVRVYSCDTCRPLGDLRRVAEAQEHSVSRRAVLLRTDR